MMRAGIAQLVRRPTYHQLDGELRKVSAVMNTQTVGNHDLLENTRRSKCIKRKAMIKKILEICTEEEMMREAKKVKWEMVNNERTGEELVEAADHLLFISKKY